MSDSIKKFPTYEQAIKAVESLKKQEWPHYSQFNDPDKYSEEIQKIIFSQFEIFPNIFSIQKKKEFPFSIYRAREISTFSNINIFAEHKYPPINVINKFGRCNFPNSPVFYGSNNPLTALIEASGTNFKNRLFCISKWELQNSETEEFVVENFLHTKLPEQNNFKTLADTEIENFNKGLKNKLSESQKKGLKVFLTFLNDSFINDDNYEVSSCLAYRSIYAKHNFATDILIYPSKQTQLQGVNFAINPNFVDNEMKVKRFYYINLESYHPESGKCKVTFSKYGEILKNVIFWKDIFPEDEVYQNNIKEDFGSMLPDNFMFNNSHFLSKEQNVT